MKFFAAAALFAATAIASPVEVRNGAPGSICPSGLYSNPQCCSAQVLGIVGVDCATPDQTPHDGVDFKNICAKTGDQPLCCVVPVVGQDLLCQVPVGTN